MIELRNVSKTVISGTEPLTIVQPLDLRVASGQYLSIVGPSGSGKSTLLGLIAGLDVPTTGEVVIDGVEIDANFTQAAANIVGLDVLPCQGANVYDILRSDTLVLTKDAVEKLVERLK